MPNHKSAEKRVRQADRRTLRNKVRMSNIRTTIKSIREAISKNDKETALGLLPTIQAKLHRAAQTGSIKRNEAARKTSRLASQISKLK